MLEGMKCHLCGSATWRDEDLHWYWCENRECFFSQESYEYLKQYEEERLEAEQERRLSGGI